MRIVLSIILIMLITLFAPGCDEGKSPQPQPTEEHHHEEGHDGHAEEGRIRLTEAQFKELGIQVEPVRGETGAGTGVRPGRVEEDPDKKAVVSAQISGTLMKVHARVGDEVRAGQVLATVLSPEVTGLQTEYHEAEVEADLATKELANKKKLMEVNDEIRQPVETASLELAAARSKRDSAQARLDQVMLKNERLEKLLEEGIASRPQVEESLAERKVLESQLEEAESALKIAQNHFERENRVSSGGLRVKAETFPAQARLARALEKMRHSKERLEQLGARPTQHTGVVELQSPIGGVVVERKSSRGETVSPGDPIAVVVDISTVWVWVELRRDDLEQVGQGDTVEVSLEKQPQASVNGVIDYISPRIDPESQTLRTRIILTDPPPQFRVGSFVNARVSSSSGTTVPAIPPKAVQMVEGKTVVYVEDGEVFRRVAVTLGGEVTPDLVAVSQGLSVGDKVVVKGAEQLKAIDLAETIGGHSH